MMWEFICAVANLMELHITRDTVLKPGVAQSGLYPPAELFTVRQGTRFPITMYGSDRGHYLVELRQPIKGHNRWYVFQGHGEIVAGGQTVVVDVPAGGRPIKGNREAILPVRFKAQYDNAYAPNSSCFLTSVAMILDYHGVRPRNPNQQLEDELFLFMTNRRMNRLDGAQVARAVQNYGRSARFTTTATFDDIKRELDSDRPCTLGTYFTHNGHIICLIGYSDRRKAFLAHDPWGRALRGGGYDFNHTGEGIWYGYDHVAEEASPESKSNPRNCWCLFVQ